MDSRLSKETAHLACLGCRTRSRVDIQARRAEVRGIQVPKVRMDRKAFVQLISAAFVDRAIAPLKEKTAVDKEALDFACPKPVAVGEFVTGDPTPFPTRKAQGVDSRDAVIPMREVVTGIDDVAAAKPSGRRTRRASVRMARSTSGSTCWSTVMDRLRSKVPSASGISAALPGAT